MTERGLCEDTCYTVLPPRGDGSCFTVSPLHCGWYFRIISPLITLYSLNVNPKGGCN